MNRHLCNVTAMSVVLALGHPAPAAVPEGEFVAPFTTAFSGGRKRSAALGTRKASRRWAVMMEALAVMPGRSLRSSLFTFTMVT